MDPDILMVAEAKIKSAEPVTPDKKSAMRAALKSVDEELKSVRKELDGLRTNLTGRFAATDMNETEGDKKPQEAKSKTEVVSMPKADAEVLKRRMTRDQVDGFLSEFEATVEGLDSDLAVIMRIEDGKSLPASLEEKNKKLARWLRACFDMTDPETRAFGKELVADKVLGDGREITKRIRKLDEFQGGPERDAHEYAVEKGKYYMPGMKLTETKEATRQYQRDLELLGPLRDLQAKLVKKARQNVPELEETWVALSNAMFDREVQGLSPWTVKQVAAMIGARLAGAHRPPNVMVAARGPGGRGQPCFVCGKPGHQARDCTARCTGCRLKCCPGSHGAACAVGEDIDLDECKDGSGRPLDDYCKDKIRAERAKAAASAPVATAVVAHDRGGLIF